MREGKSLCVAGTHRNIPLPPGTVLGDAVTKLTWNTQGVGCPCYSLALRLQAEAPGEGEKRTPAETAASQAQRQVRKAGTSFPRFLGRSKKKIKNRTDPKELLWGTSHDSRTKCWVSEDPRCQDPRLGCVNLSFLQQSPLPTGPSKKPNSLMLWDQGVIISVPRAATSHPLPASQASTQWLQFSLGSWGAHTATSAHPKSWADSDYNSENTQLGFKGMKTLHRNERHVKRKGHTVIKAMARVFQLEGSPLCLTGHFPCLF